MPAKKNHIDLAKEFEREKHLTLKQVKLIVKQIEFQPKLVEDARKIMFGKNTERSMRAAWILVHASKRYPKLIEKQLPYIVKLLHKPGLHTGTIRCCIRIFQELDIPEKYCAELFDICINHTKNALMPHGVRAFSINLLGIICKKYPDLSPEVLLILNELESFPQPPSIAHCVKKAKKLISKL